MLVLFISLVNSEEAVVVKNNTVLELQMPYPINDYTGENDTDPLALLFARTQGLDEILHAIEVAADDDDISGISINSNYILAGLSQTQAIRKALAAFKEKGKFVYAFGDYFFQKDYYLATVADSIFLNPAGALDFKGLSAEVLYFKELQEKTGIKLEVIRHGKYKSAVEPFLADEMSSSNREQIQELIGSLWGTIVDEMSESRGMSAVAMNRIADTLGGRSPEYAAANGLIDELLYYDEYEARLKAASGIDMEKEQNYVSMYDYIKRANSKKIHQGADKIAVIFAQGEILYGEGGPNIIGQGIINEALAEARDDENVKAIVLRVNSPGGSALTSDIIWREVMMAKKVKPVVVSMGDIAASGGYYIAVGADRIFAEPTTITGSIGVFGTIPNISELAGDIGINAEQVGTNTNSVDYSLFEPLSDDFRKVVQEGIEQTYNTFLQRVSAGRNISMAEADSLAQGRVWSGLDAKRLGLVDELGGLQDAIDEAAALSETDSYSIKKFPKYKSGLERILNGPGSVGSQEKASFWRREIGEEAYGILSQLKLAIGQKGVQARLPFTLTIR